MFEENLDVSLMNSSAILQPTDKIDNHSTIEISIGPQRTTSVKVTTSA